MTLTIILITSLISFAGFSNHHLQRQLIFYPPAIKQGQVYRFITHGFIHANLNHWLFNMVTLYFFGTAIETFYQPYLQGFGFIVFYLFALIIAILPSYLKHIDDSNYASLGASGAVSAVLFTYILLAPWHWLYFFGVIPVPAIVFAIGYVAYSLYAQRRAADNINHAAHLWGGAFGLITAVVIEPGLMAHFFKQLFNPGLG